MGHARALLPLADGGQQVALAQRIVQKGLSVREAERLAQYLLNPPKAAPARKWIVTCCVCRKSCRTASGRMSPFVPTRRKAPARSRSTSPASTSSTDCWRVCADDSMSKRQTHRRCGKSAVLCVAAIDASRGLRYNLAQFSIGACLAPACKLDTQPASGADDNPGICRLDLRQQ